MRSTCALLMIQINAHVMVELHIYCQVEFPRVLRSENSRFSPEHMPFIAQSVFLIIKIKQTYLKLITFISSNVSAT